MEDQATNPPCSSLTAAYPPWVMFEPGADVETTGSYSTADPKTLVVARTSAGHPIGISLRLKSPPAESRVCIHFPQDYKPGHGAIEIVAAHGDSVLIRTTSSTMRALPLLWAPQPPSLSLLPSCRYYLSKHSTGLLRRGEDELVVARLNMVQLKDETPEKRVAEVHLFRSGKWFVGRPRISGLIEEDKFMSSWFSGSSVIPVGEDMLCWVCLHRGLIFSRVYDESPGLHYVPLPTEPRRNGNVCVTAGNAVKFVNIFSRCCCGGAGGGECENSDHAYLIKTWTLKMDSMTWVLDGMMDATELWGLDAYKSLPRVKVAYPVVSMDEAHIICFMICDVEAWLIKVDMRSKMLLSVYSYPKAELKHVYPGKLLPSKVSYYLNSYPGGGSQTDIIEPQSVAVHDKQLTCDASKSKLLQSGCNTSADPGVPASEIVGALQEISSYGLEGNDMRKAISILSHGNGHRFKSYLGIPKNLRKDWLLMEINANVG
ncbi:hypothetical protein EJB05_53521, partial [Eragrostis curvula]